MAIIDDVIAFCDNKFKNTFCNRRCNEPDTAKDSICSRPEEIVCDCYNRLNTIQKLSNENANGFAKQTNMSYNCERLMYYYMCKYGYMYCTEMINAFLCVENLEYSNEYPYFNILSLGCGGAVDLMAFDWIRSNFPSICSGPLSYLGLDLSDKWNGILGFVKTHIKNENVDFCTGSHVDVRDSAVLQRLSGYNVFILPYLLSVLSKQVKDSSPYNKTDRNFWNSWRNTLCGIYEQWIRNIVLMRPQDSKMLIIINDAKEIQAAELFAEMLSYPVYGLNLKNMGFDFPGQRYYFKTKPHQMYNNDPLTPQYNDYKLHPLKDVSYFNMNSVCGDLYFPVSYCQSYQLILEVEKKVIISASRRTDIPAFYSEWFYDRLKDGYVMVRNPMNLHQVSRIKLDPDVVDAIVFWTKNPSPMLDRMDELDSFLYYFQFTLNPYGEDIEPGLPSKTDTLIPAFQKLSEKIGRERVIWRYDPIFFSEKYDLEFHCHRFEEYAVQLGKYTEKCTISFLDVYKNINKSIQENNIVRETQKMQRELLECFVPIAEKNGLSIETCAEVHDFDDLGVCHGCCIDSKLLERIGDFRLDVKKDPTQRSECGCVSSIDIGTYNTCCHGCIYCYANHSKDKILDNYKSHDPASPLLIGELKNDDKVYEREMKSLADRQISLY